MQRSVNELRCRSQLAAHCDGSGCIVLAVRLLAEVHRSRLSLVLMSIAVACWCAPLLGYWNLYEANSFRGWMTMTTTPLIAAATFWVATGAYLRMLFRDVRGLDEVVEEATTEPVKRSQRKRDVDAISDDEPSGWFGLVPKVKAEADEPADAPEKRRKRMAVVRQDENEADNHAEVKQSEKTTADAAPKRRWLGLRSAAREGGTAKDSGVKAPAPKPRTDEAAKKPEPSQPASEAARQRSGGLVEAQNRLLKPLSQQPKRPV